VQQHGLAGAQELTADRRQIGHDALHRAERAAGSRQGLVFQPLLEEQKCLFRGLQQVRFVVPGGDRGGHAGGRKAVDTGQLLQDQSGDLGLGPRPGLPGGHPLEIHVQLAAADRLGPHQRRRHRGAGTGEHAIGSGFAQVFGVYTLDDELSGHAVGGPTDLHAGHVGGGEATTQRGHPDIQLVRRAPAQTRAEARDARAVQSHICFGVPDFHGA
jgi:hypothetical protein